MITNSLLFGFLFRSIGFQFWRQVIWLIGAVIFYKIIRNQPDGQLYLKKLLGYFKTCIIILLLFAIKTMLFDQFGFVRVFDAVLKNVYGIAFLGMAYFFTSDKQRLFNFFSLLGIFISIGLIIDSITPVFAIFQISESIVVRSSDRATFLTENPTTLGVFYNFLMLCTFYTFYISKTVVMKLFYFSSIFSYLLGALLTGSRQIVLIMVVSILIVCFGLAIKKTKRFILLLFFTAIVFIFLGSNIASVFNKMTTDLGNRYTAKAVSEDTQRRGQWIEGAKQLLPENMLYWFWGKGLGVASDRFVANSNENIGSHFENTYFARFSEMGLFSWYILLFPIVYFFQLFAKAKKTFFSFLMLASVVAYCSICWISPNGAAPQSQATLFLTIGLFLYRERYDVDSFSIIKKINYK